MTDTKSHVRTPERVLIESNEISAINSTNKILST